LRRIKIVGRMISDISEIKKKEKKLCKDVYKSDENRKARLNVAKVNVRLGARVTN